MLKIAYGTNDPVEGRRGECVAVEGKGSTFSNSEQVLLVRLTWRHSLGTSQSAVGLGDERVLLSPSLDKGA